MRHKVKVFYEEENEDLKSGGYKTGLYSDEDKEAFNKNETYLEIADEIADGNRQRASNMNLISRESYNADLKGTYFFLDGRNQIDMGIATNPIHPSEKGLMLLSKRQGYNGEIETAQLVGWLSEELCDKNGYFKNPVRLVREFDNEQSIVSWRIRSLPYEAPEEFSLCVYGYKEPAKEGVPDDRELSLLFKEVVPPNRDASPNRDSSYAITINKGLCKRVELRITKWYKQWLPDDEDPQKPARGTNAKITYFFHDAEFPDGPTEYYSNTILQSFNVGEYFNGSIGKANYGVQSNTGQFSLVNLGRMFDAYKYAGLLKNGLKVQYFVAADKDTIICKDGKPINHHVGKKCHERRADSKCAECKDREKCDIEKKLHKCALCCDNRGKCEERATAGNCSGCCYDIEKCNELTDKCYKCYNKYNTEGTEQCRPCAKKPECAKCCENNCDVNWILLSTQYISDIEYDEVKETIRFKTQDRMIKFKDASYSGYKKVVEGTGKFSPIKNSFLYQDILDRAQLKSVDNIDSNAVQGVDPEAEIDKGRLYEITGEAAAAMAKRVIPQGYLDGTSIWAALQKACDIDLVHAYIDRDDLLKIDKIKINGTEQL